MRTAQDIINDMRTVFKPCIAKLLFDENYENKGAIDKAEFETEFEVILALAEMALTMPKIPQNATNGGVMQALFPYIEAKPYGLITRVKGLDCDKGALDPYRSFWTKWWNAPYKAESEDKE